MNLKDFKNMKNRRHLLRVVAAPLLLFCFMLPREVLAAKDLVKSVLLHESSGTEVTFRVPAGTRSVSLQGWVPRAKRWVQLSSRRAPEDGIDSMRVPRRWQERSLRVVATTRADESLRTPVEFEIVEDSRALTFVASHPGARLYSIEAEKEGSSGWQRISTVAAPTGAVPLRVALPASLPADARLRVMAVSGANSNGLFSPLSGRLGQGPVSFGGHSAFGGIVSSLVSLSTGAAPVADGRVGAAAKSDAPAVTQSDVWSIRGPRIYFFNQLRGLQIIDVADRANPAVAGQFDLSAVGEDMYLLGGDSQAASSAVLIARAPWRADEPEFTRVLRIGVVGDQPSEQSSIEIPGYFVESRLAGTVLHVVTSAWEDDGGQWRPRTWLTSLDLGTSGAIVQTEQSAFDFSAAQVGATGQYLWLSGPDAGDWSSHRLYAWPLRVDGTLGAPRSARLGGVLLDKFKVGDVQGGLAAVVQSWRSPEGQWQQVTAVETLADNGSSTLAPLQRLELIRNESLFATRFDGSRLYAVTFRQVDPLWLVDLSDPSAPAVVSELEVPGWSSFIEPMGDVLVAVGREDGRVQISLFDVSDPAAPALAERVYLGSAYSWSEAEWDERAVRILREEGLILLPVTEIDGATSANKVALVEFDAAQRTLRARGAINHDFSPRRAALLDDTAIASISNRELLLVDATDRDNPLLTAEIPLAFGCEFVAAKDGIAYFVESGSHGSSGDAGRAALRIASAEDPSSFTREIRLEASAAAAAAVFGDRLCIVETDRPDVFAWAWSGGDSTQVSPGSFLSVWSVSDPANPALLGRVPLQGASRGDVDLLEASEGKIAVVDRFSRWFGRPMPLFARAEAGPAVGLVADARMSLPWRGWNRGSLFIDLVDLSADSPRAVGFWSLDGEDISGVSAVQSAGDLLAFSFVRSHSAERLPIDESAGTGAQKIFAPAEWVPSVERTWLQILDLADPAAPMPWAPVEIPGDLLGVAWLQRAGGVLFTKSGDARDRVAALGFDGERASLAAEVEVGSGAVATSGRSLYAAHAGGVREWSFSEQKATWQSGLGWSFSTGYGLDALQPMDGALLAAGGGEVRALFADGTIESAPSAGPGEVARAAQSGGLFLVPAGDYGVLTLGAP